MVPSLCQGCRALLAPKGWDTCSVLQFRPGHLWKEYLGGQKAFCPAEMLLSEPRAWPHRSWAASRHSSTLGLLVRSSSRVWATFSCASLSLMVFWMTWIFVSIWKISCRVWGETNTGINEKIASQVINHIIIPFSPAGAEKTSSLINSPWAQATVALPHQGTDPAEFSGEISLFFLPHQRRVRSRGGLGVVMDLSNY